MFRTARMTREQRDRWEHRRWNGVLALVFLFGAMWSGGLFRGSPGPAPTEREPANDGSSSGGPAELVTIGEQATDANDLAESRKTRTDEANRTVTRLRALPSGDRQSPRRATRERESTIPWKTKADEVDRALARLRAIPSAERQSPRRATHESLVERLAYVSRFFLQHKAALASPVEANAPLAREIDALVGEARTYPLPESPSPIADSNVFRPAEVLAELDSRIDEQDRRFLQEVQSLATEQFAETRRETEREIADINRASHDIAEQCEAARQRIATVASERVANVEQLQRRRALLNDMAEVRRLLLPFISPGHVQPGGSWQGTSRTVDPQPVSLSLLEKDGQLERTLKGLKKLYIFGGMSYSERDNDRPRGSFPVYAGSQELTKPHVLESVKRAQKLLKRHGKAMVEQKMLSP